MVCYLRIPVVQVVSFARLFDTRVSSSITVMKRLKHNVVLALVGGNKGSFRTKFILN